MARGRRKIAVVNLTTSERFESAKDAADSIGVHHTSVVNQLRGRYKTAGGCVFQYEYLLEKID